MIIDGLNDLTMEDDLFTWCNVNYRYENIHSIRFHAQSTKHSINFVPTGTTYESVLTLTMRASVNIIIRHKGSALFKQDKQRQAMAAIWQAKEILSEMSFPARLSNFETSVTECNYFNYQRYRFYNNADVFLGERKLFNLKDHGFKLSASPFELHLRPPRSGLSKLFGSDTIIKTDVDEDCLYYMLRQLYGYAWNDRPVRTKRQPIIDPKRVFLTTMVKLAAKLAGADGTVSRDELAIFKAHFGISRETFPDAGRIFNEALQSRETPAEIASAANRAVAEGREFREYIVIGLVKIAIADGEYHSHEDQVVHSVAEALGFNTDDLEQILAMCGIFNGHRRRDGDTGRIRSQELTAYHCKVLGLAGTATLAEVRAAWRKLVQEHHPDRLQAKGVPASDIKVAEEILKAVNNSYAWLRNFHGASPESS